jgi:hypothetical protein
MMDNKQKLKKFLVKTDNFLKKYNLIWMAGILIFIYIYDPKIRWIFPIGIAGVLVALVLFTVIFCPLSILILIIAPLLWLAEKLQRKQLEKKE